MDSNSRSNSDEETLQGAFRRRSSTQNQTASEDRRRRHSSEVGVVGRGRNESDDEDDDDRFDLNRFVRCQARDYDRALREIEVRGEKCSCWMWYVIPTAPWIVRG